MSLPLQIMWGSFYLGVCFVVELGLLVWCSLTIQAFAHHWHRYSHMIRIAAPIAFTLFCVVLAHTIQVWIWAGAWIIGDVMPDWNSALYFSLVTYTTLGYGDIVLGPGLRIFGAFASVAGLLAFGLSTAYMVALMTRLFEGKLPR